MRSLLSCLRVRRVRLLRIRQIPPKGFVSQLTESLISGVWLMTIVVDQLGSTSLAWGVMSG